MWSCFVMCLAVFVLFFQVNRLHNKSGDPFYEAQENHNLIGVANVFLECLFHDIKLQYAVPIISQQGEVRASLHLSVDPPVRLRFITAVSLSSRRSQDVCTWSCCGWAEPCPSVRRPETIRLRTPARAAAMMSWTIMERLFTWPRSSPAG